MAAGKTKLEFVLVAAHQLKTSLSALKWVFKMFLDGDVGELTSEQKNLLTKGYEANESMITLVNDLLNAARLEKGKSIYNFQKHDFPALIKATTATFEEAAKRKNIDIKLDFPPEDILAVCDSETIKMAVSNFINNAINYSLEGGKITIRIEKREDSVELSIEDNGMGIPLSQQKKVFSKFFRGDNVVRRQIGGSGLGLNIAKRIIKDHGGKIWFKSQEDKGSTFYFSLPLKAK